MDKATLEQTFETNFDRFLSEWIELLRFPSISTDAGHDPDCRACAEWLVKHLARLGFTAELLETTSKPLVFAERPGSPGKPVLLLYGHYDVQPVDPLDLWQSPPFEPELRAGRLYGRGSADNKGQHFYAIKALETLIEHDADLPTVRVLIEGEEECGSDGLFGALDGLRERLSAAVLMVTDTATVSSGAPTINMGLRGLIQLTMQLTGANSDLHSGSHGGVAPNPVEGMARLIASLRASDGHIDVPGFNDDVVDPSTRERELANASAPDTDTYRAMTGVAPAAGEKDTFSAAERLGFRPSLDINGFHGGYGGPGTKTVIPSTAMAKLTARLVPAQDPQRCLDAIIAHLHRNCPEGMTLKITEQDAPGPGFRLDIDSPLVALAQSVLDGLTDDAVAYRWEGASIPVITALSETSGANPLLVGFGHDSDGAHAPNESFSIDQFRLGYLYVAQMLLSL